MPSNDTSDTPVPAPFVRDMTLEQALEALEALRREYNTTVLVVSVLTERLLDATGAVMLTITDQALYDAPDLNAVRNVPRRAVLLRVSR